MPNTRNETIAALETIDDRLRWLSSWTVHHATHTVIDGTPGALSWIGGVRSNRVSPLGVDRFGQTSDLPDLYRQSRLDTQEIFDAAAELFL